MKGDVEQIQKQIIVNVPEPEVIIQEPDTDYTGIIIGAFIAPLIVGYLLYRLTRKHGK